MSRLILTMKQKQSIIQKTTELPSWSHAKLADWAIRYFKLKTCAIGRTTVCKTLKKVSVIDNGRGY